MAGRVLRPARYRQGRPGAHRYGPSTSTGLEYSGQVIPVNNFAVRWTGTFDAESYRLTTTTDDGVRVYVDDPLVISSWWPMRGVRSAIIRLHPGGMIRVEQLP